MITLTNIVKGSIISGETSCLTHMRLKGIKPAKDNFGRKLAKELNNKGMEKKNIENENII